MAERSFITQVIQIGAETTPNTLVTATKRLQTIDFATGIKVNVEQFRPQGFKFDTVVAENREWTEATLKIGPTYTEIIYPLCSVLTNNTSGGSSAIPTGSPTTILDGLTDTLGRRWIFEPATSNPDNPQTFTIEQGSSVRAQRFGNVILTDFSFKFTREKIDMGGKAIAALLADNFTLTGSLSTIALIPIVASQISVFLDTTFGGLGTTKLTRLFSGEFSIGSRFGPIWPVDAAQTSFATTVEIEPKWEFTVIVEADAVGMGTLLPLLRNSNTMFGRVLATGPNIYTGGVTVNYSSQLDMALKIKDAGEFTNEQGVYAMKYVFDVVYDSGWNKALHWEVVNKLTAL